MLFCHFFIHYDRITSILSMNTLKKSNSFMYIFVGLIACVAVYYFKIYLALGQTNRILSLSAWIPVAVIGLFIQ